MDDSIGSVGTIYLRIPEGGVGQIQVESGNAMRTYNAKTEDGQGMSTGLAVGPIFNLERFVAERKQRK
jgi:hypothetical protein